MYSELNKLILNNEIVLMRNDVRKARVRLVHKITRAIKTLRSEKGSKEPTEKDLLKADKLVEEIRTLKELEDDNITKTLLVYADDPDKVLSDIRKTLQDRVMAKMFTTNIMETSISKFRRKYPNWLEEVPALLKNMKKKSKTKKKVHPKENVEKGTERENNDNKFDTLKVEKSENNVGKSGTLIVEKNKNNVKRSVSSTSGSWTVSGSVEKFKLVKNGVSKSEKLSESSVEKLSKISPDQSKSFKNKKTFSENEESDEDSSPNRKISRFDSHIVSVEHAGGKKDIGGEENMKSMLKSEINRNKKILTKEVEEDEGDFQDRFKSKTIDYDEDNLKERLKIGEKIDLEKERNEAGENNLKEMFKISKKMGIKKERNITDEDLEERFKRSTKTGKKVSDKKKEEMKVVDPFFMTNDNSEYLTVVSSKEQAEALQNPSKTSNHRNDDEELYYGSSLTGGFKQISHHERRQSSFTNLSRGSGGFSDRKNGNFRESGKGGERNEEKFKNREFGLSSSSSSSSHALPRRERRKLMNGGGRETKMVGEEKLHPSWEAKRRQSCPAIPQFSGKKIVFDD